MKEPLVDTFSETCASTSRKYVVEQGILVPVLSVFSVALFRFRFRKIALKLLLFWIFLSLKKILSWLLSVKPVHSIPENMDWNET